MGLSPKAARAREIRRLSGCEGKQAFATRSAAADVVDRMRSRGSGKGVEVYLCEFCQQWHMGRRRDWRGK